MRKGPSSTQGGDDFTSRKAPFANPLKNIRARRERNWRHLFSRD